MENTAIPSATTTVPVTTIPASVPTRTRDMTVLAICVSFFTRLAIASGYIIFDLGGRIRRNITSLYTCMFDWYLRKEHHTSTRLYVHVPQTTCWKYCMYSSL